MSVQDLTSYTRGGLVGGLMIDNYHRSQCQISRAAGRGARREQDIQAARQHARNRRVWGVHRLTRRTRRASINSAAAAH